MASSLGRVPSYPSWEWWYPLSSRVSASLVALAVGESQGTSRLEEHERVGALELCPGSSVYWKGGRDWAQHSSWLSVKLSPGGCGYMTYQGRLAVGLKDPPTQALGKHQTVLWPLIIGGDSALLILAGPSSCFLSLLRARQIHMILGYQAALPGGVGEQKHWDFWGWVKSWVMRISSGARLWVQTWPGAHWPFLQSTQATSRMFPTITQSLLCLFVLTLLSPSGIFCPIVFLAPFILHGVLVAC